MTKHHASPAAAITAPARAGPTSRDPLTSVEFRAIALGRSSRRPTICTSSAWRAGMSNALITPWQTLSPATSQTAAVPGPAVNATQASAADWSSDRTCVTTRTRWRSQRSTNTPATGPRKKVGARPAKLTAPSSHGASGPPSRKTSQPVASRVIQVPTSDTPWPAKKSR